MLSSASSVTAFRSRSFFILQAPIRDMPVYQPSNKSGSCSAPGFEAKNQLHHGNATLSGCDLCTRAMFIICKHEGEIHEEAICVSDHTFRNHVLFRGADGQSFQQWPGRRD